MIDKDLSASLQTSASGMKAQSQRLRVIAGNIANADTTGQAPGELPYRRQTVVFKDVLDHTTGASKVKVAGVKPDMSDFVRVYEPGHPAADVDGYVLKPNVKAVVETMDMRDAQRSYDANLNVIDATRSMVRQTIDLLKG